jgi:hypothetical protein
MTTFSQKESHPSRWMAIILIVLGFWMSGSLILDLVIMPSLSSAGMMNQAGFAAMGSSMFSIFNHLEILCAAIGLTSVIALGTILPEGFSNRIRTLMSLSTVLLGIALIYTYGLTPQMSGLSLNLNLFNTTTEVPAGMNQLHLSYFGLELLKISLVATILGWCFRNNQGDIQSV